MQRLAALNPTEATGKAKQLLDGVQAKLGITPNLMKTLATAPAALEAYLNFGAALGTGRLDAKFREQISLAVAQANSCEYCLSAHSAIGKMMGLKPEEIGTSRHAHSDDSKRDAGLQFVQALVVQRGEVSDQGSGRGQGRRLHGWRHRRDRGQRRRQHLHQLLQPCGPHEIDFPVSFRQRPQIIQNEIKENPMNLYRTATIEGTGSSTAKPALSAPTLVLLHGFPSSSHMFRDLIPQLAGRFHVIAPDYLGFGYSDAPPASEFNYTFDSITGLVEKLLFDVLGLTKFLIYVQDYGAPVGFRIASLHPESIEGIVVQNGNAYGEGISPAFEPSAFWADRNADTEKPARTCSPPRPRASSTPTARRIPKPSVPIPGPWTRRSSTAPVTTRSSSTSCTTTLRTSLSMKPGTLTSARSSQRR